MIIQQSTKAPNVAERRPSEPDKRVTTQQPSAAEVALQAILSRYPDLEGIPAAVILGTGMYGDDCAGGCG